MAKTTSIQQYIKNFVDTSSRELNFYLLSGRLNNEYIKGNQNKKLAMYSNFAQIENSNKNKKVYTERKVYNKMLAIYLTRYGILTNNMPIPGMIPYSDSCKDANQSIQINNFINNIINSCDYKTLYNRAVKRADVYGGEWIKTGIDWTKGNEILNVKTDSNKSISLYEGRPFITTVPLNEVFIDNYKIEKTSDINELVHRRLFPLEYIKKRWDFDAEKESLMAKTSFTYPKYSSLAQSITDGIEYAYVYEYYKKPDALYPKGRYLIMCNDKILWDSILPYENGADCERIIPFDFISMQSIPDNLIGVPVYSQLIPVQQTYNSVKNRYLEYVNHIAIGQFFYWEGSLVNNTDTYNTPGKLIGLKRNSRPPQPVVKDKLTAEYINYLKTLEDDMLSIAGLSQLSAFGSTKSNVRTDGVVDKLSESDENKLNNALDSISECTISAFKKLIYLEKYRQKILLEKLKMAKVDSYTLEYKFDEVNAEQLTIINREFLMKSDQIFDKKLQQAGNLGLYNPNSNLSYSAKLEFLNSMRANYLKATLDPIERATYELAKEENRLIFESKQLPFVEYFHMHSQHIQEHNLFRISPIVRELQFTNPAKYTVFKENMEAHIRKHEEYLQKAQTSNVDENAKAAFKNTAKAKVPNVQQK